MTKKNYASIDIGTNTIRLLILKNPLTKDEEIIVNLVRTARLGKNIQSTCEIPQESIETAKKIFLEYKEIIDVNKVKNLYSAATEGVRKAKNKDEILSIFEDIFLVKPEVITGEREADLLKIANSEFIKVYGQFLLFDVGGGSTEFILESTKKSRFVSIPVGILRIFEKYFKSQLSLDEKEYKIISDKLIEDLKFIIDEFTFEEIPLIGTGGTATTLSCIYKGLKKYNHYKVHHSHIPLEEIEIIFDTVNALDLESRKRLIGMDPDRADILLPGILIIKAIMETLNENKLIISDKGILFGLIYDKIHDLKKKKEH